MSDEIIGKCHECGVPCTEHDMVGNQIEFGFPVLWCADCTNRSWDEYLKQQCPECNLRGGEHQEFCPRRGDQHMGQLSGIV